MSVRQRQEARFTRPSHLGGVELVDACYRNRTFPVHTHGCYVVGTVIAGAEALEVGCSTYVVRPGDVLLLHPHEAHANRTIGPRPLHYLVFYLPASALEPYAGPVGIAPLSFPSPVVSDRRLSRIVRDVHLRLSALRPDRLAQESAFAALAGALAAAGNRGRRSSSNENAAVRRAREWTDEHFTRDFGLTDLAEVAGVSPFRLAHLFKAHIGLSPIAYRNQRRVDEARRLLLAGEPIADIAQGLGFADQSHLTRHFQRIVGISPGRYRQQ